MRGRTLVATLAIASGATACSPSSHASFSTSSSVAAPASSLLGANHVQARDLVPGQAELKARTDYQRGICRLYAAYGFTSYYPGLDNPSAKTLAHFQTIYIEGTSDTGGEYDQQGQDFARAYNLVAVKNCGNDQ